MEAYDAAVLSYALATAKLKPSYLAPNKLTEVESLTPPSRQDGESEGKSYLYQLLCALEQHIINKSVVHIQQLMEICATKQSQTDLAIVANLESMHQELRQISKANSGTAHLLQLCIDGENYSMEGTLKSEILCKNLTELLKQFGLTIGFNILKKCI